MVRIVVIVLLVWTILFTVPSHSSTDRPVAIALFGDSNGGWGLIAGGQRIPGYDISVYTGGSVKMSLVSEDNVTHNFGVDYNGNGQPDPGEPFSGDFPRDSSDTILYEFSAAETPGTYVYRCYYHPQTMFGQFNVLERGDTTLSVFPSQTDSVNGSAFQVALLVSNVQDLYWYEIRVRFDPSILEATGTSLKGTWVEASGIPVAFSPTTTSLNNTTGEVHVEVRIQGTFPGFTGSGSLAYLNFTARESRRAMIVIDATATKLYDSQFLEIPYRLAEELGKGAISDVVLYSLIGGAGVLVGSTGLYLRKRRAKRVSAQLP